MFVSSQSVVQKSYNFIPSSYTLQLDRSAQENSADALNLAGEKEKRIKDLEQKLARVERENLRIKSEQTHELCSSTNMIFS